MDEFNEEGNILRGEKDIRTTYISFGRKRNEVRGRAVRKQAQGESLKEWVMIRVNCNRNQRRSRLRQVSSPGRTTN